MDNEITVPGGSPSPSGINKNEPARRVISGVRDFFARVTAPFAGMGHLWMAFILPVLIMALIYVAMEVWPFGKSSVLVLDLNGQYVYYFEALRDILHGEQGWFFFISSMSPTSICGISGIVRRPFLVVFYIIAYFSRFVQHRSEI